MAILENQNQRYLNNLRSTVEGFTDRTLECHTIGISNNITKITRTTELLEHSLRQKQLTKEQEKLLDNIRTEYERALDILEENCICRKRK
jgi:hypothetical protein